MFPDMSSGVSVDLAGRNGGLPSRNLISSSNITSIREDDVTMALCIEGAIPSDTVIDISVALPARSNDQVMWES